MQHSTISALSLVDPLLRRVSFKELTVQPADRHQRIVRLLENSSSLRVSDLAKALSVSDNTIRNDLESLAEQGLVERTHGGATIPRTLIPPQLRAHAGALSPQALHIVSYAVSWIQHGDSLIIGDGPLCVVLAEKLVGVENLRVITPSLAVAYILVQDPTNTVVLAGGEVNREMLATSGSMAQTAVRNFRADKAFFTCTGVSAQGGLTEVSTEAAQLKQQMKGAAASSFVLIESDRVGKSDLFSVGALDDARRIVTDVGLNPAAAETLAAAGARVTTCWEGGHKTYRPRADGKRRFRIGFANLSDDLWFSQQVRLGLESAAREAADSVELLVKDNQTNVELAVRNAESFLQADVDLLIEYDGTGRANRPIRRLMRTADVPIIAVDIPIVGATHFGCDHDAAGITVGRALALWILTHWGGHVDELLVVNNEGGGTMQDNNASMRVEGWTQEQYLDSLTPFVRFQAALEVLQADLPSMPEVRKLTLPGLWRTSAEAVAILSEALREIVAKVPAGRKVAALCLVEEDALGFADAVRASGSPGDFVVMGFGGDSPDIHHELARPDTVLAGIVNLHAERYGSGLLQTALRLLRGEPISPAVFVEHTFLSRDARA